MSTSSGELARRAAFHVPRQRRDGSGPTPTPRKNPARTTPASSVWVIPAIGVVLDVLCAAVALVLAGLVVPGGEPAPGVLASLGVTLGITVLWVLAVSVCRGHDGMALRAGVEAYRRLVKATAATAALVGFACYLAAVELNRNFFVLALGSGLALMCLDRVALRRAATVLRRHGLLVQRVLIVGEESHVDEFSAVMDRHEALGYVVVGALTPLGEGRQTEGGVRILGEAAEARHMAYVARADLLLFAGGGVRSSADLRRVTWDLQDHPVRVAVAPSVTDIAPERIRMRPVGGVPLLDLEKPGAAGASKKGKRLFDIVFSLMLILATSPLFLFVAWKIRRHDGGPIFFRHERIGRDEVPFGCWKFRTMGVNADQLLAELLAERGVDGAIFAKLKDDPRITPPGRWLRRLSLDELPQLFNVLLGHMSLVGPRPQVAAEVAEYDEVMARRLHVKPGMTGLWQVSGRSDLSVPDAIRLDAYYVENWSMLRDLSILFRTPLAVLGSRGAY